MANTFSIRRVSPGNYVVNDRYAITRIVSPYTGPAWLWRDMNHIGVGGEWRNTKASAVRDLKAYLEGNRAPTPAAPELAKLLRYPR